MYNFVKQDSYDHSVLYPSVLAKMTLGIFNDWHSL